MRPEPAPLTGKEDQGDLTRPVQALVQFYKAFNGRDLGLMERNWDASGDASMDNPLGGIKRGWGEIQTVYRSVFTGPARVYVEFYDYTIHESADIFFAVGRERGWFEKGDLRLDLAIRTSRIYRRSGEEWRQVHHHGSIEDPDLLKRYQTSVLGTG